MHGADVRVERELDAQDAEEDLQEDEYDQGCPAEEREALAGQLHGEEEHRRPSQEGTPAVEQVDPPDDARADGGDEQTVGRGGDPEREVPLTHHRTDHDDRERQRGGGGAGTEKGAWCGAASLNASNQGLYEPSHGSAPDIAGKGVANPLATILSAAMMLRFSLNQPQAADRIESAVKHVLAQGLRTADIYSTGTTRVGTREMGDAVVAAITHTTTKS